MEQQFGPRKLNEEDILKGATMPCKCGGIAYESFIMFKRISPLISPTMKEEMAPVNLILCKNCGKLPINVYPPHVYALMPDELKIKEE